MFWHSDYLVSWLISLAGLKVKIIKRICQISTADIFDHGVVVETESKQSPFIARLFIWSICLVEYMLYKNPSKYFSWIFHKFIKTYQPATSTMSIDITDFASSDCIFAGLGSSGHSSILRYSNLAVNIEVAINYRTNPIGYDIRSAPSMLEASHSVVAFHIDKLPDGYYSFDADTPVASYETTSGCSIARLT
jgi:hypothetical protein